MIYTPDDNKEKSYPLLTGLWAVCVTRDWTMSIDYDEAQIRYVAKLDWTTEHLPPSIVPFMPKQPMTTEEAAAFFSKLNSECVTVVAGFRYPTSA